MMRAHRHRDRGADAGFTLQEQGTAELKCQVYRHGQAAIGHVILAFKGVLDLGHR